MEFLIMYFLSGLGVAAAGWIKYSGNHSLFTNIGAFIGFTVLWPAILAAAICLTLFD